MKLISLSQKPSLISINNHWIHLYPITPEKICACSQSILLNERYMTHHLQENRRVTLHIKRLSQHHHLDFLKRTTFLLDQIERCHLVANIEIFLEAFSPSLQKKIIESILPFGQILQEARIQPIFKERNYFTLREFFLMDQITPYRQCCPLFFGRSHKIINTDGKSLAEVWEILT